MDLVCTYRCCMYDKNFHLSSVSEGISTGAAFPWAAAISEKKSFHFLNLITVILYLWGWVLVPFIHFHSNCSLQPNHFLNEERICMGFE